MADQYIKETEDLVWEHSQHKTFTEKCSECSHENRVIQEHNIVSKHELIDKANGCNSGNRIETLTKGRTTQHWHRNPFTSELVIINEWVVPNGPDDIDYEWEVVRVYPPVAADLAELNKGMGLNKFYE